MSPGERSGSARAHAEGDSLLYGLRVVRERWRVILASVVVCVAAAAFQSLIREDSFQATARVLFGESQVTDAAFNINRDTGDPERDAATQVLVATSPEVADRVRRTIQSPETADALLEQVTVQAAENANVLEFTATEADPGQAARVANAFADQYVAFNRQSEIDQLEASQRALERQRETLEAGSEERDAVNRQLTQINQYKAAARGGTRVLGNAEPPTARSAPQPRRDVVLGVILGLVLGITLAFLIDFFDRRMKEPEQFEEGYRLRTLAAVPQTAFAPKTEQDRTVAVEPYRVLRNALGFAGLTTDLRVLLITSAVAEEGKSTVAINLARATALSGQRVVLVECDLRRPSIVAQMGLADPGGGLTTALVGRRPAAELLRPASPGLPHFSVLPSGPLPPNAAELLRSSQMGALLEELSEDGSMVILDAPPLVPVADAQGLLDHPQIDACLIVGRTYHTTRDDVRRARNILDQHRLEPLGLVVTGIRGGGEYGYYGPPQNGSAKAADRGTRKRNREGART